MKKLLFIFAAFVGLLLVRPAQAQKKKSTEPIKPVELSQDPIIKAQSFRLVGPFRGGRAAAARQCLYVGGAAEAVALTERARLGGRQGGGGKENRGTRSREGRGCETRKLFCGKGSQDRSGSFTCTTSCARAPPRSSSCTVIASFLPISHLQHWKQ